MTDDERIAVARDALARLTRQLDRVEDSLVGKRPAARHDAVFYTTAPRPTTRKRSPLPPLGFYR